ncbi:hypothetical protein BC835DRAFT_1024109 [Cytidiella melzeri]|nr:hypothetical protein BC835DRAFT_1024109 [Cytidiella melzeri]
MDLDGFEDVSTSEPVSLHSESTIDAIRYFDSAWYGALSRKARWMDLVGDYAGNEPFVIDGDSLLQLIFSDKMLALARSDLSMQLLHAKYLLERTLSDFLKRTNNFDVVFWEDNRHSCLTAVESPFEYASLCVARQALLLHLEMRLASKVKVYSFQSVISRDWAEYVKTRKVMSQLISAFATGCIEPFSQPMYVMINDGDVATADSSPAEADYILLQRAMIFELMSQGLACCLLFGSEFRDSKILSFVFDQRLDPSVRKTLAKRIWITAAASMTRIKQEDLAMRRRFLPVSFTDLKSNEVREGAVGNNVMVRVVEDMLLLGSSHDASLDHTLLYVFIAHMILLPTLAVGDRARHYRKLHPTLNTHLRSSFLPKVLFVLERRYARCELDIDGRIFLELLASVLQQPSSELANVLGSTVYTAVDRVWMCCGSPSINIQDVSSRFPPPPQKTPPMKSPEDVSVMPFQNTLFQEAISSVQAVVLPDDQSLEVQQTQQSSIPFVDTQHWHNHRNSILPKHLGGAERVAQDAWQRNRQLRSEQRFVAKMQWQAESLTGALGRPLQRMIIVPHKTTASNPARGSGVPAPKQPNKAKKEHVGKADRIRIEHAAKKRAEQDSCNVGWWQENLDKLKVLSVSEQIAQLERLSSNKRVEEGWLAVEVQLYQLHLCFTSWIHHPDRESTDAAIAERVRDEFTVRIMRIVKDLFERGNLFPKACDILGDSLRALGFSAYYATLRSSSPNPTDDSRGLSFKFVKLLRTKTKSLVYKSMHIVESPVEWQLRLFGEYMDRSMDSQYDPRVAFKPDAWQREVLDCLDQEGHSVLVVAPTSAGKTFISYYAMEQVLRSSDDDILVYVAPTKALVSQIAAEVYARFQKTFKSSGKSVWAIHTRDYRVHDPQKCQILVTVPEMLAIMLLSPPLARVWTPRIKRIILDEIHTIGQQEGGAVWEQIILLAPCPIIGLSATIGAPEKFNEWLRSVQEAHGFRHTFINWPHRYSHLRKFEYVLRGKPSNTFCGLNNYVVTERMRFLHPVSMLSFGPRNLPPDFSLEAADCLSLYQAFANMSSTLDFDVEALAPVNTLPADVLLKQKDVLAYESLLKARLEPIVASSDTQDSSSLLNQIVRYVQDPVLAAIPPAEQIRPASASAVLSRLLDLIADLHKGGDLPAILFHFDRTGCEIAAHFLLDALEDAEANWRKASPEWARTMLQWETWKSQAKQRQAQEDKIRKGPKDPDDEDPRKTAEPAWQESFNPDEPTEQFSFLGPKCSKGLLREAIADIEWTSTPKWVLRALERGIGIHHSGMNKHYRTTVESLYRLGHLRVVVATGTLALGINAPTKTSVFCSDSPFLTALMYRQCAGRAGRRGFDLLGKVVFYGLPMDRVQRLVLSRLPALGGNFPLTSTMVLRLFNLLHGSGSAPYAVKAINSLLHLPQVSFTSETGKSELMHHIRFSIDYLRRSGLLDEEGNPINLFGLTNHLYYTEPSNFALATLLQKGVIHRICRQSKVEYAKLELLHLLCHLFGRRNLPRVYTSAENVKALLAKSPSKVVLQPMSKKARKVLLAHDKATLKIFSGYATAFARQSADHLGPDLTLPLSGVVYSGDGSATSGTYVRHLRSNTIHVTARSLFVANSGHDDVFDTIDDLTQNVRSGIHLKEHGVPSFRNLTSDNSHALNAYILDFYIHGQTEPLVIANGIRRGEIWYLLQDFVLTLKTIRASLAHMFMAAAEADTDTVQSIDPAEVDIEDGDGPLAVLVQPPGMADDDWKVYKVVHALTESFDAKFREMWA